MRQSASEWSSRAATIDFPWSSCPLILTSSTPVSSAASGKDCSEFVAEGVFHDSEQEGTLAVP